MTMTRTLNKVAAAALLASSLGACSRSEPEPAAVDNRMMESADTPAPVVPTATPEATAPSPEATQAAQATDVNATAEAPPAADPAPDEQMMDDASATGMTARASRGDHPSDEPTAAGQPEVK